MRRMAILLVLLTTGCGAATMHPFPNRDPIWVDADQVAFGPMPDELYTPWAWDQGDNVVFRQLSELWQFRRATEAVNVNSLDEVPSSSWFENRIGVREMNPSELAIGACPSEALPPKPWQVVQGKLSGTTPGAIIEAADGQKYVFKLDFWQPERGTAADAIATRFFHALGYYVPCNQVVFFEPSDISIAPGAHTGGRHDRPYTPEHLASLIDAAGEAPGGMLRASVSRFVDGTPLGGWQFDGVRDADPNDVFAHQDRREVRGMYVASAWLNHIDTRAENNLDIWVETDDDGNGFIRHLVLDAGDSLGIAWPSSDMESQTFGVARYLDLEYVTEDLLTLGLLSRPYRGSTRGPAYRYIGYYDVERFDPEDWRNGYPNEAFERRTERDSAWMARIISRLDEPSIRAMVETGRFSKPLVTNELVRILRGRQMRILERFLTRLSPLANPVAEGDELCLDDLALRSGLREANGRAHSARSYLGWPPVPGPAIEPRPTEDGRVCVTLPARQTPGYVIVDVIAETPGEDAPGPARVHLYQLAGGGYRVVGLERPETREVMIASR